MYFFSLLQSVLNLQELISYKLDEATMNLLQVIHYLLHRCFVCLSHNLSSPGMSAEAKDTFSPFCLLAF